MTKLAKLENLMDAYDAVLRAGDFMTTDDPRGHIRASNVLLDRCIDAGMPHDDPNHVAWATARVTRFMLEA